MITTKKFSKESIEKYKKYLDEEASKFKLTGEDLGNLFDLHFMVDTPEEVHQDFFGTLKLNNMDKWFKDFFGRIQKIVIWELKDKKEETKIPKKFPNAYGRNY